ncbi:hypothetical protein HMPREF9374_0393 [Desmospora sp. 8437]|nr:hypothetical protein HMPREF9374_0393 [Desmospora sp. 8437]
MIQYSPWGERLSMVKHKSDGTEEDSFYGYNPHTDVEVLTDEKGDTRATCGYTAYGKKTTRRNSPGWISRIPRHRMKSPTTSTASTANAGMPPLVNTTWASGITVRG